jgi:hypothetical protein
MFDGGAGYSREVGQKRLWRLVRAASLHLFSSQGGCIVSLHREIPGDMENIHDVSTWQNMLAELIKDTREKERLAAAISMQPITLTRWARRTSHPREQNMSSLVQALPPHLARAFRALATVDFPGLKQVEPQLQGLDDDLPPCFYAQLLEAHARLPFPTGRLTLQDLLFQQAIEQLDPERHGMSVSLAVCVRPLDGSVVRSLREVGGIGNPPWKRDLEQKTILLGAESLAGYALTHFRRVVVPNRTVDTRFPVHWTEYEQSAVAVPIARYGLLCGCLLASSTIPDYFLEDSTPVHLLEKYAHLAALLFEARDFYAPEAIRLSFMPPYEAQLPYFQNFNSFIQQQFRLAQIRGGYFTLDQAREQVWREIEDTLIQNSASIEKPSIFEEGNI